VVTIHDFFVDGAWGYVVMPYYANGTLANYAEQRRAAGKPLTQTEWEAVWRQLLLGLVAMQGQDVVHCDIRPDNIFVSEDVRVVLGDFDVSQDTRGRTQLAVTMTRLCVSAGSRCFTAPELEQGSPASSYSDMFSFGATVQAVMPAADLARAPTFAASVQSCLSPNSGARPSASQVLAGDFFAHQAVLD